MKRIVFLHSKNSLLHNSTQTFILKQDDERANWGGVIASAIDAMTNVEWNFWKGWTYFFYFFPMLVDGRE